MMSRWYNESCFVFSILPTSSLAPYEYKHFTPLMTWSLDLVCSIADVTRGSLPIGPNREDLLSLKTVHTYHHSSANPEFVRRTIILCTTNKQTAAIKLRHPEDCRTGGNFRAGEREKPNISHVKRKHLTF